MLIKEKFDNTIMKPKFGRRFAINPLGNLEDKIDRSINGGHIPREPLRLQEHRIPCPSYPFVNS